MKYTTLGEEPLKSAVAQDFFKSYKYTQLGNIDFVIAKHNTKGDELDLFEDEIADVKSILWAEAKQGTKHDFLESFVQLLLTIGKERTFEKNLPPKYIGAFDAEKFAFIEYHEVQDVFVQNDFNWNVTPSNHATKEFKQLYNLCKSKLEENSILFRYATDADELKKFIQLNFKTIKDVSEKISVTKNNFTFVFQKWNDKVKPTIAVDWAKANKVGLISADFFLADLLSDNNMSIKENLFVVLKNTKYELAKKIDENGFLTVSSVAFKDKQKAYKEFWAIYERPPKEEYWEFIVNRRDLLVPQDIRERKGSFFTPQIWVEKSQEYLAKVLGETWQDDYVVWDCCAGTGNLENGLTNYDNVWVSTLDKQDIDVMVDRVNNGWNMPENHIFQFDFLNDDFSKCPEELQAVLSDAEKRKKLLIYINPPYAEASNKRTSSGTGINRKGLSETKIRDKYLPELGKSINELFAQFLFRIYKEIDCCKIANFSTLKFLCAPNFSKFRALFKADLLNSFIVPANTFDNVSGQFPIGFFVWNTENRNVFTETLTDVYNSQGILIGNKKIHAVSDKQIVNKWLHVFFDKDEINIGWLRFVPNDFQNNNGVYFVLKPNESDVRESRIAAITIKNLIVFAIYFTVRHTIEATWLNDRDQFLFPNDGWKMDFEFQSDCLVYALFHGQNRISSAHGVNHWIPFTREQVGCKKTFKSKFMQEFISNFLKENDVVLSREALSVYGAGLELWKYFHSVTKVNPDASFYDIRKFFQGETKGRMNSGSDDETYMELVSKLRKRMKSLAMKIEPKIYKYGFLK